MDVGINPKVTAADGGRGPNRPTPQLNRSRERSSSGPRANPAAAATDLIDFTVESLAIQEENSSAAESALRDADTARAVIESTRNRILANSGTSILAQGNVAPQSALSLLR